MAKKTTKTSASKKTAVKKAAPAKPAGVKKAASKTTAKKTPAKKGPAKKAVKKAAPAHETRVVARVDVGFGNSLYIRGEGAGLSWDAGVLMENTSPYEWVFTTTKTKNGLVYKFLINDEIWAEGDNQTVAAGKEEVATPAFNW